MDKKALIQWEKILDAYFFDTEMSKDWRLKVRELLFFDESYQAEKWFALEKIFENFCKKSGRVEYI
ncbi:MAG: hypothetical protein LBC84_07365 [Prevotellaceae bacterium]|jgi:hypothetical protein|nr:hypothetical protein [Prevotellaceae bacterium]